MIKLEMTYIHDPQKTHIAEMSNIGQALATFAKLVSKDSTKSVAITETKNGETNNLYSFSRSGDMEFTGTEDRRFWWENAR